MCNGLVSLVEKKINLCLDSIRVKCFSSETFLTFPAFYFWLSSFCKSPARKISRIKGAICQKICNPVWNERTSETLVMAFHLSRQQSHRAAKSKVTRERLAIPGWQRLMTATSLVTLDDRKLFILFGIPSLRAATEKIIMAMVWHFVWLFAAQLDPGSIPARST